MEYVDAKKIVSGYTDENQWFGINYNMNIYKGCCHGCIYCDSRSDCYGIENFDKVRAKKDSIQKIQKELKSKKIRGVIGTGAMSDPYNPFEERLCLTREALKLIDLYNFGIGIATKSPLITRDIDILRLIRKHSPVIIKITITTYEDELCKKIEPNVAPSSERFRALKELSDNGIFAGILLMPILPYINDNEDNIRKIVKKAKECGAKFIYAGMGVTLRGNQREHFYQQMVKNFPKERLVAKYMDEYGDNYECHSIKHKQLWNVFKNECEKAGILYKMKDIINEYKNEYEKEQISFF